MTAPDDEPDGRLLRREQRVVQEDAERALGRWRRAPAPRARHDVRAACGIVTSSTTNGRVQLGRSPRPTCRAPDNPAERAEHEEADEDARDRRTHSGCLSRVAERRMLARRPGLSSRRAARSRTRRRSSARAPVADRRRERRAARRVDRHLGAGAGLARRVARRPPARGRARRGRQRLVHAARRLGARSADRRPHGLGAQRRLARRLPQRARRRRGPPPDRRGRDAGRHGPPRRLGRRGGRALRPIAVRLVGGRRLDGRPGRAAQARRPRRRLAPRRARRVRRRSRPGARRSRRARERGGLPRAPHRAGPGARVARSPARGRARHVRRRTQPDHVDGPGGARGLDADGPAAATRSPARPSSRSRFGASRTKRGTAPSAPRAGSSAGRGS